MDTEALVSRHRADLLRQLVELARDKTRAQKLLEDLGKADMLLNTLKTSTNLKYAKYKKAREALIHIFDESKHPWVEDDIVNEMVNGGWRGGLPGTALLVRKALWQHLYGDGSKKWPLKKINGLIGPKEWPDELFKGEK